jgi:tRNA pseudouridine13 synthase
VPVAKNESKAAASRRIPVNTSTFLPDWSRAHGGPLLRGRLRQSAEDFEVTEVLGFEPDGNGEHDFLWIEKKHTNTTWLARQLADFAGIAARDVGFSGMKDRLAVTRQWFSVRRPGGAAADWSALEVEGARVLKTTRNTRKLRRGAHAGNQFRIVIRNVSITADEPGKESLEQRIKTIGEQGVPDYFGEQRFGREGNNLGLAESFFAGKRLKREKRSIALSSARAWLFNHALQIRVEAGLWSELEAGDIAALDGSGSIFVVQETDETLRQRCRDLDLHPTGPLWGAGGSPLESERIVVEQFPNFVTGLEKHTKASRRSLRLAVRNLTASLDGDALTLDFYLARGGFATAVLRELVDYS